MDRLYVLDGCAGAFVAVYGIKLIANEYYQSCVRERERERRQHHTNANQHGQ